MPSYNFILPIPAYDAENKGLIVPFRLSMLSAPVFKLITKDTVAASLETNFKRIIDIMSALKPAWQALKQAEYFLACELPKFLVKDSKSSSMALCIALMNAQRVLNGKTPVLGLTGTGVLRIDGSFDHANLEGEKYQAAKDKLKVLHQFITPSECRHLFDLEKMLDAYQ